MSRANPGRVAAARALIEVEQGAHVEDALARLAPPPGPDRALSWFLALGVLRRRAHVDAALRARLSRPLHGLDAPVRAVLRVGAYERLFAQTPPHAAVDQAVELTRALGVGRARGLVNAVVRRVREPTGLSRAESLDHPAWLVERWTDRYGAEATEAWCRSNGDNPPLTLVSRRPELATRLREAGLVADQVELDGEVVEGALRISGHRGSVEQLPGFAEGWFWVQDAASVAVADLVGAGEGTRVLDACAAPGGKAFRMASHGARVTAVDRDERRLALVVESAQRLGLSLVTRVHDWTAGPLPEQGAVAVHDEAFDAVLVDAPCTGLGTVRRHPEIRWRRQPGDLVAMAATQRRILEAATAQVRTGGVLVYAVCSPEPEEGVQVVEHLLGAHPDLSLERELCTAPALHGADAFYGARMIRR